MKRSWGVIGVTDQERRVRLQIHRLVYVGSDLFEHHVLVQVFIRPDIVPRIVARFTMDGITYMTDLGSWGKLASRYN